MLQMDFQNRQSWITHGGLFLSNPRMALLRMELAMLPQRQPQKKYLLIDDDPLFCLSLKQLAESYGMNFDSHSSLASLGSLARLGEYDVLVVDFHLDEVNGGEIAEYVEIFFGHIPLILISGSQLTELPRSVTCFVNKAHGFESILTQVLLVQLPSHGRDF